MKPYPLAFFAITACASPSIPTHSAFTGTWVQDLATDPQQFGDLMASSEREGWISYHSHNYRSAHQRFSADSTESRIGKHRSAQALAELFGLWTEMQTVTTQQYFDLLSEKRPGALTDDAETVKTRAATCDEAPRSLESITERLTSPYLSSSTPSGTAIHWYDPCAVGHLAHWWSAEAERIGTPLDEVSTDTNSIRLARQLFRGSQPTEDVKDPTTFKRRLIDDGAFLRKSATPEGKALLDDLDLTARYTQESLLALAAKQLSAGAFSEAYRTSLAAYTPSAPIGPQNNPMTINQRAAAQLGMGQTREALTSLAPIKNHYPEAQALLEWLGDLAVLQGLDRQGDSKEN